MNMPVRANRTAWRMRKSIPVKPTLRNSLSLMRAPFLPLLLCLLGVSLLAMSFAGPVHGQASSETARFQLADTYLRAGQFDRAISLLEDLYAANPEYAFFAKLKQAYEGTKKYNEALELIDSRLRIDDNKSILLAEKARILYLSEDIDSAFAVWDLAISVAPDDAATYRMVHQSLTQVREFDRAIALLDSARTRLGDPSLFRRDLGNLYTLTSQYSKSMEEYVGLLLEDARHLATIKSNLSRYATQDGVVDESVAVVEREVRQNPLNVDLRELLGWLYVESDRFEPALDTYRAIDRLQNHQGRTLFAFAGQALASESYAIAFSAYEEILARYPDSAIAPEALRGTGDVHVAWARSLDEQVATDDPIEVAPHYSQALNVYTAFLEKYPVSQNVPYVLLDVGRLEQDVFRRFDTADEAYERVVKEYPTHAAADEAKFEKGRLAVLTDRLEDARLEFNRIADRLHTGDLAEECRYEVALIHFYRGEFEAAGALVGALKENTSNNTANDAIGLRVLLIENPEPDSLEGPLSIFARAMLLQRQYRLREALLRVDTLRQQYSGHEISDESAFLGATLLEQVGDYRQAHDSFIELSLQYTTSFLSDRSVFAAAWIQEKHLGSPKKAIELYERLLVAFPGSLFSARARERIRNLRGDNV